MGFDNKYFTQAENELNEIRLRNYRLQGSRENEIYEKYADIAAINRRLLSTSGRLLMLIADKNGDISEKLESLKKENLSLQQDMKTALKKYGYPENYLDPIYSCPVCKDKGTVNGRRCSCFMNMVKKAAADDLNSTSPLKLSSFDEFDLSLYDDTEQTRLGATARKIMAKNLSVCREYAENFHIPYTSLLIRGRTGLGKTHLSLSIASVVLEKGYSVIYCSAPDIFRKLEREQFGNAQSDTDTLEMLIKTDLLVLDDLGAEFDSKFYRSALYNIINDRMNYSLPMIINTNYELAELEERYGERIYSRMATMDKPIFIGSDIRAIKKRRQ